MSIEPFDVRVNKLLYETKVRAEELQKEYEEQATLGYLLDPGIRSAIQGVNLLLIACEEWHQVEITKIKDDQFIRNNMPNIECTQIRLTYDPEVRIPRHGVPKDQFSPTQL